MPKFMLALRGNLAEWKALSATEVETLMNHYGAWTESLRKAGRLESGHGLGSKSVQLVPPEKGSKAPARLVDGPYVESKEALTGYFVITAESLDEAVEIARGCPALMHGETVEVLPTGD